MGKIYITHKTNKIKKELNKTILSNSILKGLPKCSSRIVKLLSKRGVYNIGKGELDLYKLQNVKCIFITHGKYDLIVVPNFFKKIKKLNNTPFEHYILETIRTEYIINPKLKFVVESDLNFYFEYKGFWTPQFIDEINSFLYI